MTAAATVIRPGRSTVKEPSLNQLAKQKARGSKPQIASGHLAPDLAQELNAGFRSRANKLRSLGVLKEIKLSEDDQALLYRVGVAHVKIEAADVVHLTTLFDRHREALDGEPANGHANGHMAFPGNGQAKKRELYEGIKEVAEASPIVRLPLKLLDRHPDNRHPLKADIEARAASIKEKGQLDPITVRPLAGGRYQVLSGETRWLAVKHNGGTEIDARLRECDDAEALDLVAIANAQRKDLNPIERAQLVERLCQPIEQGGAGQTRDEAAQRVGLATGAAASNLVRLLKLPKVWQERVAAGELDQSWARSILPVLHLEPVMKELEKEWAARDKDRNWPGQTKTFDSRHSLEEEIRDQIRSKCRSLNEERWNGSRNVKPKIDASNPEVAKKLGIITVEMPTGKRGQTETVQIATNAKAFDDLVERQMQQASKAAAEKAGRDKPKKKLSAAEAKEQARKATELLKDRREWWRHKLLRKACIEAIDAVLDSGLRIVLAAAADDHRPYGALKFGEALEQARGVRAKGTGYYDKNYWSCVAEIDAEEPISIDSELTVVSTIAKTLLAHETKDWRRPTLAHSLVEHYAAAIGIKIEQAWGNLHNNDAGRDLAEELFLVHPTEPLRALAKEFGVYCSDNATRASIAKTLIGKMSMGSHLKLPSCIKPLGSPGKGKRK